MSRRSRIGAAALAAAGFGSLTLVHCVGEDPPIVSNQATDAASLDAAETDTSTETDAGSDGGEAARCHDLAKTCGRTADLDCCASRLVPAGTFDRGGDAAAPATISAFEIDVYEVTVGRFREFVNAGKGTQANPPRPGDGEHPKNPMSGWTADATSSLAATRGNLETNLACNRLSTWTATPGSGEARPINCITWFEAFAFCAWDGGRLPTEAEWHYVAAGGSEQREYPWGAGVDASRASYNCAAGGGVCAATDILPVGTKSPAGDGRWGHADLAGNVAEWVLDSFATDYPNGLCSDCANLSDASAPSNRVLRGGSYGNTAGKLLTTAREPAPPSNRYPAVGFRCARPAK